tara:strand:- start:1873 stop:2082 length:210 start_codon:yes stop_codon:yes gene_type:complete
MSKLSREERRKKKKQGKLVNWTKPGTENNDNPTFVVGTKRRYRQVLRKYNKTINKGKKVKKTRTIRANF